MVGVREAGLSDIQNLLDKAEILHQQNLKRLAADKNRFNVFDLFFKGHEEVNLHSRFLFELLNPAGSHLLGGVFLQRFLERLPDPWKTIPAGECDVYREWANIDILVRHKDCAIVIENKPNWGDQPKQLQRYFDRLRQTGLSPESIQLIYLTREGREASDGSIGTLAKDKIINLSYEEDILPWVQDCAKESVLYPRLRESILQYESVVKRLVGQLESETHMNDIKELLFQNGRNLHNAIQLSKVLNEAKEEVQLRFWNELEKALEPHVMRLGLSIDKDHDDHVSPALVSKYYSNKGSTYYRIRVLFPPYKSVSDYGYLIEIKYNGEILHGFYYNHDAKYPSDEIQSLADCVPTENKAYGRDDWWLGHLTLETGFVEFDTELARQLVSEDQTKRIVEKLAGEISEDVEHFLIERKKLMNE